MIDERTRAALSRLTENERACLVRRLSHQTAKEMAIELGISPHAVEKRLKMARTKLGVSSSLEAARLLEASERYGRTGPQAPDLGPDGTTRQESGDPMPRWRRIAPLAVTGALAMSVIAFALLALAPPSAPEAGAQAGVSPLPQSGYLVQLLLRHGDKPIGSPRLVALPGRTVRATATNADGTRYDVALTVEAREGASYLVRMDVNSSLPNGRSVHVTPAALVRAGEPTNLMSGPAGDPLNMTVVVTPADAGTASTIPPEGTTTLKALRRSRGMDDTPPRLVKVSPELVRQFVNETFDNADKDHSGFIERAEAPEQAVPVNPVTFKGRPDFSKGPPPQDENERLVVIKGPMGQAAYIALWDRDADGRASRKEYMDGNFEKFLAWGVPANWRGVTQSAPMEIQARKD